MATAPLPKPDRRTRQSFLSIFFFRLRQNRVALFGTVFLLIVVGIVVLQPFLPLKSATRINVMNVFAPISAEHWLGTDENGRDVLARLIVGGRVSFAVGFASALLTIVLGSVLGVVAGYFGGTVDRLLMRFTDGLLAIPTFFLLLVVVAIWGSSITVLVLALSLTRWMGPARLIRGEILRFKEQEFTTAAHSMGARDFRIMFVHLLPQALPALIVATSIGIGDVMLIEAGLSFLGLGVLPPVPSWGNMLTDSQYYMWSAPLLAVYPGLLILLSVLAFNSI